jgi:peptidoglycan/xylan/chitin deacetylase (PgdA/CDA1 family)
MRFVIIGVSVLVGLGLAALGVVFAQKVIDIPSVMAPAQNAAANANIKGPAVPVARSPVRQIAQGQSVEPSPSPAANPAREASQPAAAAQIRVAQNTPTQNPPAETAAGAKPAAGSANAAASPNGAGAAQPGTTIAACDKPGGMGLSRVVEIDTTGGPGFGFEHFKQYDFLRDKEVVLTFDDGPWPENTPAVLKALTDNCLKATFFEIGEHAMWHPQIAKQVFGAGMTVGTHTWSHKDLARNPYASDLDLAKQEIEMGISAVHAAIDAPIAPFFRFPALQHPPQLLSYLAERNIASFSTDIDSFDFKKKNRPDEVIKSVMSKLEKRGKGIILMHDFQRATAEAMPELIRQLKAGGYKVVHLVPHQPVTTLPKYDEMLMQQDKLSVNNTRPENSVFHTIGEYKGSPAPAPAAHD